MIGPIILFIVLYALVGAVCCKGVFNDGDMRPAIDARYWSKKATIMFKTLYILTWPAATFILFVLHIICGICMLCKKIISLF